MLVNILLILILIAVLAFFAWLAGKARRSKRALLRWPGVFLSGLLAVVLGLVAVILVIGMVKLYTPRAFPVANLQVDGTPERIARGAYLASMVCVDCHTTNKNLPLSGGGNLSDTAGLPLGSIYAANLTPAGELREWTDGEIVRAIREGTHKNGRPLLMPVATFKHLSDEDVHALVAYLRSQPAMKNDTPQTNASILTVFFLGVNLLNIEAEPVANVSAPLKEASSTYGEYVLNTMGCKDCHGADLQGGKPPLPQGPHLGAVQGWTQEQFVAAMRTGATPSGRVMSAEMPWNVFRRMEDVELAALYAYLQNARVVNK
jgi:mono/diheme cytochrome c family protein